jgi:hypothetical protein
MRHGTKKEKGDNLSDRNAKYDLLTLATKNGFKTKRKGEF